MTNVLTAIKNFLGNPVTTIVIIVAVIASRIIQLVYFYNIGVDVSFQLMGTQNFLDGHGISLAHSLPSDLSQTLYSPLIKWPPGYSILVAPLLAVFGNYIVAGLVLDIVFAVVLIFTCRGILKLLLLPVYLRNLFTLLTGFFIYFFYFNPSSDSIAITFFVLGIYYCLRLFTWDNKKDRNTLLMIAMLFLSAFTKYLFMPLIMIVPALLWLTGRVNHDRQIKKLGGISFIVLVCLVGSVLLYQKVISGSATYISSTGRGFYPGNLAEAYPFFPATFIKPDTITSLLPGAAFEKSVIIAFQFMYLVTLAMALFFFTKRLMKKGFKTQSPFQFFAILSSFVCLAIIAELGILSLFVEKEEIFSWRYWTYIEEARYYGLGNVLLQLLLFAGYWHFKKVPVQKKKIVFTGLVLLMVIEMTRTTYFLYNRIRQYKQEEYSWQFENRFQQYADSIIRREKEMSKANTVVATGTSYYFNHRVAIYSKVPLLDSVSSLIRYQNLKSNDPAILIIILERGSETAFNQFLSQPFVKLTGRFERFDFYVAHIKPQ